MLDVLLSDPYVDVGGIELAFNSHQHQRGAWKGRRMWRRAKRTARALGAQEARGFRPVARGRRAKP